jgi:hypothetical protein
LAGILLLDGDGAADLTGGVAHVSDPEGQQVGYAEQSVEGDGEEGEVADASMFFEEFFDPSQLGNSERTFLPLGSTFIPRGVGFAHRSFSSSALRRISRKADADKTLTAKI